MRDRIYRNSSGLCSPPTTHETVALPHNRFDALATLLQFLTQAPHVNIQGARIAIITVAPDAIQKLLARYNAVSAFSEHRQQRELLVSQLHLVAIADYPDVVEIDL